MIMYLHLSFSTKSPLMNISLNLSTIEYTRPHITSTSEIMIHHLTSFVILFFFNLYISLPLSHTIFHCTITFLPPYLLDLLLFHKKKRKTRKKISKRKLEDQNHSNSACNFKHFLSTKILIKNQKCKYFQVRAICRKGPTTFSFFYFHFFYPIISLHFVIFHPLRARRISRGNEQRVRIIVLFPRKSQAWKIR